MKIGIIGAGGDVGRELTGMYLSERLSICSSLTLFYHSESSSRYLQGMLYDSMIGRKEQNVRITNRPEDLTGLDVAVICAGVSIPSDIHKVYPVTDNNRKNGKKSYIENRKIVLEWAEQIHRFCPQTLLVLVTNPVAGLLAEIASAYPDIQAVGCGIANDTLRVRNEAVRQFPDCPPEEIFMIGEHDLLNQTVAFSGNCFENGLLPDRECFEMTFESVSLKDQYLTDLKDRQNRQLSEDRVVPGLYEEYPLIIRSFLRHRLAHFLCKTHRSTALAVREVLEAYAQEDRWISVETAVSKDPDFSFCILGIPIRFRNRRIVCMEKEWAEEEKAVFQRMADRYPVYR